MRRRTVVIMFLVGIGAGHSFGDDFVHRYEGDVLPYDEPGWRITAYCEEPCVESLGDSVFVLSWAYARDDAGYAFEIADPTTEHPPSLWVEWRFRSNHPIGPYFYTCDGEFSVKYGGIFDVVFMYGDAAVSFEGGDYITGLDLDAFHTYRFESLDGINYWVSADGDVFLVGYDAGPPNGYHSIGLRGNGGCAGDQIPNMVNEWDYVRFGTISYGEQIVSSDPPQGFVNAREYSPLDRFTVTFDSANYVYIDEIGVSVTAGVAPAIMQTRRLDNGDPETVEVVLDRPIPFDASTKFLFNDGVTTNRVIFTFAPGDTDGDGDADLHDFAAFQTCFGKDPLTGACYALDSVTDDWIDLSDYVEFLVALDGP